jgi:hypothetical protein
MRIQHVKTTPYSHEENGIVERANKEVMEHLRAILFDKNMTSTWSEDLPIVQRIINASKHSSTGVTPAQLLFGNSINLDRRLFFPNEQNKESNKTENHTLSKWCQDKIERQSMLINLARQTQKEKDDDHINKINTKTGNRTNTMEINDFALVTPDRSTFNIGTNKLEMTNEGPYRVVNIINDKISLQDLITVKTRDLHRTRVIPFRYDANRHNPEDIAIRNKKMFIVEKIISHKGKPKIKSTMSFLVKWLNYPDEENTWEPWKSLRNNTILHQYLETNNLN